MDAEWEKWKGAKRESAAADARLRGAGASPWHVPSDAQSRSNARTTRSASTARLASLRLQVSLAVAVASASVVTPAPPGLSPDRLANNAKL